MNRRCVRNEGGFIVRRSAPVWLLLPGLLVLAPLSRAQVDLGPVTVGAGLRTSYVATVPDSGGTTNQFLLNDIRLYVNGPVYKDVKFMFNTDYNGSTNSVNILDAVARIEINPELNIWAGRFLPPSDRANLYGPFYAHEWDVYTDGIQDGFPSVFQGRDNGIAYWGDFAKKVKVSIGGFDGGSAGTGHSQMIGAARVQVDFWDPEGGYYLNGTYYGDKNLLAIGAASQIQDGHTATTIDFLLEKKVPGGGAFTIESEYSDYNRFGGYNGAFGKSQGVYVLGSFLVPKKIGVGQVEFLGKYAKAEFTHGSSANFDQKTTEINLNYVIKQFNMRVMSFCEHKAYNRGFSDSWSAGIGLQVQM